MLKKHLLDAEKVPGAGKKLLRAGKTVSLKINNRVPFRPISSSFSTIKVDVITDWSDVQNCGKMQIYGLFFLLFLLIFSV